MPETDLQPDAPAPDDSPFAQPLRLPQFGILHLMIWTAVTAVLLKFEMVFLNDTVKNLSPTRFLLVRISYVVYSITLASEVVGSGILIRAKCFTMLRRLQPGHWIVLISTVVGILELGLWMLIQYIFATGSFKFELYLVYLAVAGFVAAIANMLAVALLHDAKRWKVLFGALATSATASAVAATASLLLSMVSGRGYPFTFSINWASILSPYWSGLILLGLLAAAVLDLRNKASRDWLHWLGVFALGLGYSMTLAWDVLARFLVESP